MKFIPIASPTLTDLEKKYLMDAYDSGWISSVGQYVDEFESKFAAFCGTQYAVAVGNGTLGLHLSLAAAGVEPGDEVIVPDLSFIATANAVVYCGAIPVFCDVEPDTLCIDPKQIEALITPKTKAIVPVHLYGHPADMEAILTIAKQHRLIVIEDAAEAHGAAIKNKKVGSWGEYGVFSFYGNKIITTGEGGMITVNDEERYNRLRFLRDHAMSKEERYWHHEVGYNYRITNLQAAIGVAQLERVHEIIERKTAIFRRYAEILQENKSIKLNSTRKDCTNVYWMVCAEIEGLNQDNRKVLLESLKAHQVDSRPYFFPISDMPMYQTTSTPIAHSVYKKGINLPTFFDLTPEQVDFVCNTLLVELEKMGL